MENGRGAYGKGGADAVKNFLMYIDDVLHWRSTFSDEHFGPLTAKPKITIHVPADYPLELDATADELRCSFEVNQESSGKLTVFDLPPPTVPSQIVILTFDVSSSTPLLMPFSVGTRSLFNTAVVTSRSVVGA